MRKTGRSYPHFFDHRLNTPFEKPVRPVFNAQSPPFNTPPHKNLKNKEFPNWSLDIPGEGRARPPVEVDFAGTVMLEKPDPLASDEDRLKRAKEIEDLAAGNKAVLEKAIFILSQSPTGRNVLEEMTREGYKIVFDNRRTEERNAGGLCDAGDQLIILHAHDSPEYLALLLGHECVHAVQNTRYDLFPSALHRPEVGIKLSFAIEADAYAQQTQISLELDCGDPKGPPDQIRFAGPAARMHERFPDLLAAARKAMQTDEDLQNGATVTAAFQAFYDNFYLRTFYEDAHMDWVNMYAPKLQEGFNWFQRYFSKDIKGDWIKDRIQHNGIPYLKKHAPHLDFDDTRHAGLTEETWGKVHEFYKKFLPREKPPAVRIFGTYMKNAVSWVLGLTTSMHMIITQGNAPTKPPLRSPPRRKWIFWK